MIRDNPTLVDVYRMSEAFPIIWKLRPLLLLFGKTGREAVEALDQLRPEVVREIREALDVPDRFNSAFSSRGWVAYWGLGAVVMQRALDLANEGDIDAAEEFLADYYDRDSLEYHFEIARESEAVRNRQRLLRKAMEDHLEGRYHASVPVVLAQIDGIAIDLTGSYFFSRSRFYSDHPDHMVAADSFAGHPSGLRVLAAVLGRYRGETTMLPLDTPYRHGVLHGRDLEYDTKLVSSKSFAALFAVAEWARKAERGELTTAVSPAWPDAAELTPAAAWREIKGLFHSVKQLWISRRTGRPFQRTPAMRATFADRIMSQYGVIDTMMDAGEETST
ncbi:MAG: hypothetical protein M3Q29_05465 [Chloroflexota bacterium]|nr:hypothetical protein [Chloroflexota bacterium]